MPLMSLNFLHKNHFRLCAAALCTAMLFSLHTEAAQAAVRKDVSEYAGRRCNTPPRGSGVIVGMFQGYGESAFNYDDNPEVISRYRCFRSMEECRGWLYTMQSLYSAGLPRIVRCIRR